MNTDSPAGGVPGADAAPVLARLMDVIESRRRQRPSGSYVVELLDGGAARIGDKVQEEAAELAEAAAQLETTHTQSVIHEAADVLFHTLVLLCWAGVSLTEVEAELDRRFGTGGLHERAMRQDPRQ